jgi:hypothetical protein
MPVPPRTPDAGHGVPRADREVLRYAQGAQHVAWGYAGLVFFVLATIGAGAGWIWAFASNQPPLPVAAIVLLAPFSILPVVALFGFLAAWCWAYTRPAWGERVEGSVYRNNHGVRPGRPVDVAAAERIAVRGLDGEGDYCLRLDLSFAGTKPRHIALADSACTRKPLTSSQRRLMLALADAIAESTDDAVGGQTVSDLRELARARPEAIRSWIESHRPGARPGRLTP